MYVLVGVFFTLEGTVMGLSHSREAPAGRSVSMASPTPRKEPEVLYHAR